MFTSTILVVGYCFIAGCRYELGTGDIELDMILTEVRKITGRGIFAVDFGVWKRQKVIGHVFSNLVNTYCVL